MQEDDRGSDRCLCWLNRSRDETGMKPTKQHNHRAILPFQSVLHASRTGFGMFDISKLNKVCSIERVSLEKFFQDTHHIESHWSNKETGSGRLNWLDKHKDVRQWQGVTVYADDEVEHKGRVLKFQLSKNNICGM